MSSGLESWVDTPALLAPPDDALLLIAGGVGPRASIELHAKILKNTITEGDDQSHLDVLHLSYPARIADRTRFLCNGGGGEDNPGSQLGKLVGEAAVAQRACHPHRRIIVGVPCVTFHAQAIYGAFERELRDALDTDEAASPPSFLRAWRI